MKSNRNREPHAVLPQPNETAVYKATVRYLEGGFRRQQQITASGEEELFKAIFWFQAENYPLVNLKTIQFRGAELQWDRISTYAHYWLAKNRMSFDDFKKACLNEPEIKTA